MPHPFLCLFSKKQDVNTRRTMSSYADPIEHNIGSGCTSQHFIRKTTLLYQAAQAGDYDEVVNLIEKGANVNKPCLYTIDHKHMLTKKTSRVCFSDTPFEMAFRQGHFAIAQLLLDNGSEISKNIFTNHYYFYPKTESEINANLGWQSFFNDNVTEGILRQPFEFVEDGYTFQSEAEVREYIKAPAHKFERSHSNSYL